jgi:hypothetical protein
MMALNFSDLIRRYSTGVNEFSIFGAPPGQPVWAQSTICHQPTLLYVDASVAYLPVADGI